VSAVFALTISSSFTVNGVVAGTVTLLSLLRPPLLSAGAGVADPFKRVQHMRVIAMGHVAKAFM
jgi:hypothetical protein